MKKILPLLLLTPISTNAECTPTPDCANMGYTETSCNGKFVRCPFDTSKLFCVPCDTIYKYSCSGDNIASGVGISCNGNYSSCTCSSSDYIFSAGQCLCKTECNVGAIYYSDGTCSACLHNDKTPIGVVVKDNELIASIQIKNSIWGKYETNITGLTDYTLASDARTNYTGKNNTVLIATSHSSENASNSAGIYCHTYSTTGTDVGDWYLPAAGELNDYIYKNYWTLKKQYTSKLGWGTFDLFFWSSTEFGPYNAWGIYSSNGTLGSGLKNNSGSVICFYSIK